MDETLIILDFMNTLIDFTHHYGPLTNEDLKTFKDLLDQGYDTSQAISQLILERV